MAWPRDPTRRRGVPRQIATQVYRRDGTICHVCGHPGGDHIDHKINHAKWLREGRPGSPDHPDNLAPIHGRRPCPICGRDCHALKSAMEAAQGRAAAKARNTPRHPGLL